LPATTLPFNQYDWPLIEPKRPRPSDWQRVNDLSRQIAVTLPFDLTEWPLPKRVDSPRGRNWELANDLGRQTAVTLPFSQTDWPLPDRADSPLARDRQRINDLGRQTAVTLPKQITEWPLAKPRRFLPPYWQPTNDLARKTFVRLPAQPYDWPLPKVARPKAPETPLPDTALLRTVVVVVKPFAQMGWELPQRTDSPIAREAWPYITILPEGAAQPFSQTNWPLPLTGRPDVAPEIPANLLPIHVPPVPPEEFRPKGKIPHIEAWDLAHLRNQQWINQLRIVELWGAGDQSAVGALEAFVVVPTVEPSVSPATRRVVLLARPIAPWSAPGVASSAAAGAPSVVLLPDRVSEEQEIADAMAALRPYLGSIGLNKPPV
jgi:hypothetical protein